MAAKTLFKPDSKLAFDFLRKHSFALPQLATPSAQTTIIDESLRLPPNQKPQHPHSAFSLADFLGANQKLFVGEEGVFSVRECLQINGSTLVGALWAKGRGGSSSSRQKIDSDEEVDDDDADEFDAEDFDEEFDAENFDEDGDFGSDDDDDDESDKFRRKK